MAISMPSSGGGGAAGIAGVTTTSGSATTTTVADTTLITAALDDNTVYYCEAVIVGRVTSTTGRYAAKISCLCYREAGGNAFMQGTTVSNFLATDSIYTGNIKINATTNIVVQVNGANSITMDWFATLTLTKVT